jgi:uncharacterized membrane protein
MPQETTVLTGRQRALVIWLQKQVLGLSRHWLAWTNLFWGVLFGLPWLAPVLMQVGASGPARGIYFFYGFLCHQYANRSFFLFGPKVMYTFTELQPSASNAGTWLGLRAFVGTTELGYKVAWSDRMISMYGGILLGGLIFALVRHRLRPPCWLTFGLLLAPITIDGITHMIADLAGVGQGFRYDNAWLATLTGNLFPESFYLGNALGSLNSWMRLITGLLCGLAVVWLAYPYVEAHFRQMHRTLALRLEQPRKPCVTRATSRSPASD